MRMSQDVLEVRGIGPRLSQDLVSVLFSDGTESTLDPSRIKSIYFFNGKYYIIYETDNIQFYAKHATQLPELATELNFYIKEVKEVRCNTCHSLIEWDADEPYCPKCGFEFDSSYSVLVKLFVTKIDRKLELESFASKLFQTACVLEKELYRTGAGGYLPNFELKKIGEIRLFNFSVDAAGVVVDPGFTETHYDEINTVDHKIEGKYAILHAYYENATHYVLFSMSGEPKLDTLEELAKEFARKEEEERKKREEERKKWEEERKKREEEQRRKWSDKEAVVKEILAYLPDWADGAYVKEKVVRAGDADVIIVVYPSKRSKYDSGFYVSESWRPLSIRVPSRFLRQFIGKVITEKEIISVKETSGNGKYINLKIV
jgi:Zn finger protein HypA/HybF involved in hydrogenase expression